MILRKLNEMIFGAGLVATVLGIFLGVLLAAALLLRFTAPLTFVLPNGLRLQNPTFSLRRLDVIGVEGRILRLRNDWACFDDRTVYLSGPSGRFAVDAKDGRVISIRRPTDVDDELCGEAGYFTGLTGHDLFLEPNAWLPCEMLNPDLDRFAQAQRFRDLCGLTARSGGVAVP